MESESSHHSGRAAITPGHRSRAFFLSPSAGMGGWNYCQRTDLRSLVCEYPETKGASGIMQLVEQHVIDRRDPRFTVIDAAAFQSKNLYNAANYEIRQAFFHEGTYLNYHEVQRRMQSHEAYKALPAKISQQVLLQLHHDWESFFKACAAYEESPSKFLGRPRLPKYKHKTEGRNILVYTIQAISKRGLKR